MGAIRTCCGYFCSFIALVAVPFFVICIAMEGTKNQFQMWRLNMPIGKITNATIPIDILNDPTNVPGFFTQGKAITYQEDMLTNKMIAMAIAIGINIVMIPFCIWCTSWGNKKQVPEVEDD